VAALGRIDEAKTAFGSVVNADGDDWPPLAGLQLWVQALREKNDAEANAIFLTLSNRYQFEQLSALLPPELHDEIIGAYFSGFDSYGAVLEFNPDRLQNVQTAAAIDRFLSHDGRGDVKRQLEVSRAFRFSEQFDEALKVAEGVTRDFPAELDPLRHFQRLLRITGKPQQAIDELNAFMARPENESSRSNVHIMIMRARSLAALQDWENAERDIDSAIATQTNWVHAEAPTALIKGFLLSRRGSETEAEAIWRDTFLKHRGHLGVDALTSSTTMNLLILGSLMQWANLYSTRRHTKDESAMWPGVQMAHVLSVVAAIRGFLCGRSKANRSLN
jgi:tetratricopeptide (TPR) repeat protein